MRTYKISICGYGSEVTIGSVTEETKKILSNPDKELVEAVDEDLDEIGGWHEIDDQFHKWGASGGYTIEITDEEGETVLTIDSENLHDHDTEDFELVEYEYVPVDETKDLLMCISFEKGSFFQGDITTEDEFDITKMRIKIYDEIGISQYFYGDIVGEVYYDGEEVDNYGGDTNGKSFEAYKNF
jgi:hypothetical protein